MEFQNLTSTIFNAKNSYIILQCLLLALLVRIAYKVSIRFKELTIFTVQKATLLIFFFHYILLLPFTPILEYIAGKIMRNYCDIEINGDRPWDPQILDKRLYAKVMAYGGEGMSQSYVDKWFTVKDPEEFGMRCVKKWWYQYPVNRAIDYFRWNWLNLQTKELSAKSCNTHYNLGPDFFESLIDPETSCYSVAYWENATTLAQAQKDKMELAARKLKLEPGMRVLDLGCGFGGLSKYLAETYKVNVLGIANSDEMAKGAAERCKGLPVEICEMDWRDLEGKFDRIVCIEMVFHVGRHNLSELFQKINSWLKDGGIFVMQDFLTQPEYPQTDGFMSKYFYPNHYIPKLAEILEKSTKYLNFEHFQDMTEDSIKTAQAYFKNFDGNWPKIKGKYNEKLYDAMVCYMLMGGVGISRARLFLCYQMTLTKPVTIKKKAL